MLQTKILERERKGEREEGSLVGRERGEEGEKVREGERSQQGNKNLNDDLS